MDLNLIRPLCALLEERHVSRAAERCGISQPSMSRILDRLRETFGDKLLVRSGGVYDRTPRGELLLAEMQDIINRVDASIAGNHFVPAVCDAKFRLATTDYASAIVLPALLHDLREAAPHASLLIRAWNDESCEDLAAGRLDAAIMSADNPPDGLRCDRLFGETYVCMVAKDHPLRGRAISLAGYLEYDHAVIDIMNGQQPSIDQPLVALGHRRRLGLRTPFLGAAILAAASTTMILTLPMRFAERYQTLATVRLLSPPNEIGPFSYSVLWHKRLETSLAHVWLRERIRTVASNLA